MESKVIEQKINASISIHYHSERGICIEDCEDLIYIDTASLPELIAALQSFLPKETE